MTSDAIDQYHLLGPSGLRVSPLCLGTATFGHEWGIGSDEETCGKIFRRYLDAGGNFVDTANCYNEGTSEIWLGRMIADCRDRVVLATKGTFNIHQGNPNTGGNHRRSLTGNVEESLRRMKTDYIDLFWCHVWDRHTPLGETMRVLDDLVNSGKIRYVGVSNWPAWSVASGNTLAEFRSWTPFIAHQVHYNLCERNIEHEIVPQALAFGMGICPWAPLEGGLLTGKHNPINTSQRGNCDSKRSEGVRKQLNERTRKISEEVQHIARETGRTPSQVALNWLMKKPGVVSPVIGARTLNQLQDNLKSLEFSLDENEMERLESVSRGEPIYPNSFIFTEGTQDLLSGNTRILGRR